MLSRLRGLVGPCFVAVSAWCALGHVTVASPADPSVRLVVSPHVWLLFPLLAAACLVRAWRNRPSCATPALFATLPWWPVAWPAVFLLWTGYLAWIPIALAVWAAIPDRPFRAHARPFDRTRPLRSAVAAGAITFAAAILVAWSVAPDLPNGDEPNYLVITQSLLQDGDLRIQNNFDHQDYAAYFPGPLKPDYLQKGKDGQVYSIHAPGLPVLVLPAFAAFGYRGAQATVIALAALGGALIWLIGWRATGDRGAAWFAWAAVTGTSTFLIQAVTIFPDGPAVPIAAAGILLLLALDRTPAAVRGWTLVLVGTGLSALPWLHTRFAVLGAGLGAAVVLRILGDTSATASQRWRRCAMFLAVPFVSTVFWFGYFWSIYGTFNPVAPYGSSTSETRLVYAPGGVTGLLFDNGFGLFTAAPVLVAAAFAFFSSRAGATRRLLVETASVAGLYLVAVGTYWQWWAGTPAPPARFATAILPVFVAPLATAWTRAGAVARACISLLLVVTIGLTCVLVTVDGGAFLWNVRGAAVGWMTRTNSVTNVGRAWASFFWRLTPGDVRTELLFFEHVALGLVVCALTTMAAAWLCRREAVRREARLVSAWWFLTTVMLTAGLGWMLLGVNGLDSGAAAVDVVRARTAGGSVVRISQASIRRAPASLPLWIPTIRSDRSATGSAFPDALVEVPAGTYAVRVVSRRATAGVLSFRIGESARPFLAVPVSAVRDQVVSLALPVNASRLEIEPDDDLSATLTALEMLPLALPPLAKESAQASAAFGSTSVFFFDDHVFIEDDGFWVRRHQTASVEFVAASAAGISLALSNGPVANAVTVDAGSMHIDASLAAGASRVVAVPAGADRVVRVRITSPAGFRPADVEGIADRRELGVHVSVAADGQ